MFRWKDKMRTFQNIAVYLIAICVFTGSDDRSLCQKEGCWSQIVAQISLTSFILFGKSWDLSLLIHGDLPLRFLFFFFFRTAKIYFTWHLNQSKTEEELSWLFCTRYHLFEGTIRESEASSSCERWAVMEPHKARNTISNIILTRSTRPQSTHH